MNNKKTYPLSGVTRIFWSLLFIVHYSLFTAAFSQPKPATPPQKTVANPQLTIALGAYPNGSKVSAGDMIKLLKLNPALVLKDNKGNVYTIISFEFTWRQKSVDYDVITGKPKINYTTVGQKIKDNKLNEDWVEEITESLHAGDTLHFSTILYTDAKKKKNFLAPDLTIEII